MLRKAGWRIALDLSLTAALLGAAGGRVSAQIPRPPALIEVTAQAEQAHLRWIPPASGSAPASYSIHRGDGAVFNTISEVPASVLTFTDQSPDPLHPCYLVKAKVGSAESQPSNAICGTGQFLVAFRRGNANSDDRINLADVVSILRFRFLGEPEAVACRDAADFNDDGKIDITDPVGALGFLFLGQPPPPAPGPDRCGIDPTVDLVPGGDLGCERGDLCPPRV